MTRPARAAAFHDEGSAPGRGVQSLGQDEVSPPGLVEHAGSKAGLSLGRINRAGGPLRREHAELALELIVDLPERARHPGVRKPRLVVRPRQPLFEVGRVALTEVDTD